MSTETRGADARELRPCPFCSGEARMIPPTCRPETPYDPRDRLYPIVTCWRGCGASVPGRNEDYEGWTAVLAWNQRRGAAALERVEALEGAFLAAAGGVNEDGLCWCMEEDPGATGEHDERCARLRALLSPPAPADTLTTTDQT